MADMKPKPALQPLSGPHKQHSAGEIASHQRTSQTYHQSIGAQAEPHHPALNDSLFLNQSETAAAQVTSPPQ